jgi:hypothetical protein
MIGWISVVVVAKLLLILISVAQADDSFSVELNSIIKDSEVNSSQPSDSDKSFFCNEYCLIQRVKIIDQMERYCLTHNATKERMRSFRPELNKWTESCLSSCKH